MAALPAARPSPTLRHRRDNKGGPVVPHTMDPLLFPITGFYAALLGLMLVALSCAWLPPA